MISRIASVRGRWVPVTVVASTPKQMREGVPQYVAQERSYDLTIPMIGGGDSIEEAVDNLAGVL